MTMQLAWKIATSPSLSRNYADLAGASRPVHLQDAFSLRHPAMPAEKRAKLFQPYDALDGYSDAIRRKRRQYEKRRVHTPESEEKLGKQLAKLSRLCPNSRAALRVQAVLTVCYFVPNDLPDTDDRWGLGDYVTVTGLLRALSPVSETLLVGETLILFREIWSLRCLSLNTPLRAAVPGTACSTRA